MSATNQPTAPANRGGRPSKFTPSTRARLVELVARGLPYAHACRAVGISFASFCAYRKANDDFQEEIEVAVAAAIEKRLKVIETAANAGDVNSAKWLLEHLHPQHFARNRIEVTGADGAPLSAAIAFYLPHKDGAPAIEVKTDTKEIENE